MVFLTGPRQVGKTTLAKAFLPTVIPGVNYFNWDLAEHRKILQKEIFPGKVRLEGEERQRIVFDEIHKFPRWKNTLKGLFDLHEPTAHWIVTGSAMLNVYRRGQDSLVGRHFTYHLSPFSVAECLADGLLTIPQVSDLAGKEFGRPDSSAQAILTTLLTYSGFPEPYLKAEKEFLAAWRTTRLDRLINQDLAATEMLRQLPLVEKLMFLLPERVGSPLSLNSLREDLEVHFATVKHWMELLERVFYGFFVRPFAKRGSRMLHKEGKWFLWDWTEVEDPAARFENLMAVHLLKYVLFMKETGRENLSLHYVRDKEKREVDFLICRDRKPALLVECKLSESVPDPSLIHFARLLGLKNCFQVTQESSDKRVHRDGDVMVQTLPAVSFLKALV